MTALLETHRQTLTISTDPARLDDGAIAGLLSRSYGANDCPRSRLELALEHSLVFGLYDGARWAWRASSPTAHFPNAIFTAS